MHKKNMVLVKMQGFNWNIKITYCYNDILKPHALIYFVQFLHFLDSETISESGIPKQLQSIKCCDMHVCFQMHNSKLNDLSGGLYNRTLCFGLKAIWRQRATVAGHVCDRKHKGKLYL